MTVLRTELVKLAKTALTDPIPGAPDAELTVAPNSGEEAAALLAFATEKRLRVQFWGGGTHQGIGNQIDPDVIMSSGSLGRVIDWQADDLTVVVEAGVAVSALEAQLEQRAQTAVLPEEATAATVGGVVAAGLSGWQRLRYGPTRDRVIECVVATGDGRLVRGGGRLVKNVTGYDLPRLLTGSLGSLGFITSVCLKLWPLTTHRTTVTVLDAERALANAYRPHAVIETNDSVLVYLAGTDAEIEAQVGRLDGSAMAGHHWPEQLAGGTELVLRLPPVSVPAAVNQLREDGWQYQAAHGVGEVRIARDDASAEAVLALRNWAEAAGGTLMVMRCPAGLEVDPWGTPPASLALQKQVKAAFDPRGVANPGIHVGGM